MRDEIDERLDSLVRYLPHVYWVVGLGIAWRIADSLAYIALALLTVPRMP